MTTKTSNKPRAASGTPAALIEQNQQYLESAALTAGADAERNGVEVRAHGSRGPPPKTKKTQEQKDAAKARKAAKLAALRETAHTRLMSKDEVLAITGVTYPALWAWMKDGRFPRCRIVGGRSMWISTEVEQWLEELPLRPLRDDDDNDTEAA